MILLRGSEKSMKRLKNKFVNKEPSCYIVICLIVQGKALGRNRSIGTN